MTKVQTTQVEITGNGDAYSDNAWGMVKAVVVEYESGSDAGTDVTVAADYGASITKIIFTKTDYNTSKVFFPRVQAEDTGGVRLTYDGTRNIPIEFPVDGRIKLTVAGNGATKYVKVRIIMEVF